MHLSCGSYRVYVAVMGLCGCYRVYMAVTGSMWLLQGLCGCYRVYVAVMGLCGCYRVYVAVMGSMWLLRVYVAVTGLCGCYGVNVQPFLLVKVTFVWLWILWDRSRWRCDHSISYDGSCRVHMNRDIEVSVFELMESMQACIHLITTHQLLLIVNFNIWYQIGILLTMPSFCFLNLLLYYRL